MQLENVAINDILSPKATRCDAIANLKCFEAPGRQQPNFDGFIYFHDAALTYSVCISVRARPKKLISEIPR